LRVNILKEIVRISTYIYPKNFEVKGANRSLAIINNIRRQLDTKPEKGYKEYKQQLWEKTTSLESALKELQGVESSSDSSDGGGVPWTRVMMKR
jgi:hypothetical protein